MGARRIIPGPLAKFSPETGDLFESPPVEPVAHARREDRATSHEAAASVTDLTARQQAVLHCLAACGPAADVEWIPFYRSVDIYPLQTDSSLRTRRCELVDQGRVVSTEVKLIGRRRHTVWKVG